MQPPNKDQMLFSQLFIAHGIIESIFENLENTIFNKPKFRIQLTYIIDDLHVLQTEMKDSFYTSEGHESVCY